MDRNKRIFEAYIEGQPEEQEQTHEGFVEFVREVIEDAWPELAHKLPPRTPSKKLSRSGRRESI
jgi:hypothetical protein